MTDRNLGLMGPSFNIGHVDCGGEHSNRGSWHLRGYKAARGKETRTTQATSHASGSQGSESGRFETAAVRPAPSGDSALPPPRVLNNKSHPETDDCRGGVDAPLPCFVGSKGGFESVRATIPERRFGKSRGLPLGRITPSRAIWSLVLDHDARL